MRGLLTTMVEVNRIEETRRLPRCRLSGRPMLASGEPFALAGIWENGCVPETDTWIRTFVVVTCPVNDLIERIHDRMPVIIAPEHYDRRPAGIEPDPRDLLIPFPVELMTMWPVSRKVNRTLNADKTANDSPDLLVPIVLHEG